MNANTPNRRKRKLAFDPTISLGHVLSTIGILMALIVGWTNLNARMAVLENTTHNQEQLSTELRKQVREDYRQIMNRLDLISSRIPAA